MHQVIEHRLFLTMSRFYHLDKLGLGYSYAEYRLSTYQILYNKARQIPRYLQDTIELIRRSASHPALCSHTKPPHNRLSSPNSPPCPLSIIRMHQPKIKLYITSNIQLAQCLEVSGIIPVFWDRHVNPTNRPIQSLGNMIHQLHHQ